MHNDNSIPELMVVLPVYNEQASIRKVVLEWFNEILNWTTDFVMLAIDDGSTDNSAAFLRTLQKEVGECLRVVSRENRGHGQTCIQGYRTALDRGIPFVFQIDSDGQCDPQYFFRFWQQRNDTDVIFGIRRHRDDGWRRVLASSILRIFLFAATRVNCPDANVPYRLIRTSVLSDILPLIPEDFFLANVAVSVLLRRRPGTRHRYVPIHFCERYGGEPSIKLETFRSRAFELYRHLQKITLNRKQ